MTVLNPAIINKSIAFNEPHTSLSWNQSQLLTQGASQIIRGFSLVSIEDTGAPQTTVVLGPGVFCSNGVYVTVEDEITVTAAVDYPYTEDLYIIGRTDSSIAASDTEVSIVTRSGVNTDSAVLHIIREDGSVERLVDAGIKEGKSGISAAEGGVIDSSLVVKFKNLRFANDENELVFLGRTKMVNGTDYTITGPDELTFTTGSGGDEAIVYIVDSIDMVTVDTPAGVQSTFNLPTGYTMPAGFRPIVFNDGLCERIDEFTYNSTSVTLDNPTSGGEVIEIVAIPAPMSIQGGTIPNDANIDLTTAIVNPTAVSGFGFVDGLLIQDVYNQNMWKNPKNISVNFAPGGTSPFTFIEFHRGPEQAYYKSRNDIIIYVNAATGDDNNSGLTAVDKPVASLKKAIELAKEAYVTGYEYIQINAQGTFTGTANDDLLIQGLNHRSQDNLDFGFTLAAGAAGATISGVDGLEIEDSIVLITGDWTITGNFSGPGLLVHENAYVSVAGTASDTFDCTSNGTYGVEVRDNSTFQSFRTTMSFSSNTSYGLYVHDQGFFNTSGALVCSSNSNNGIRALYSGYVRAGATTCNLNQSIGVRIMQNSTFIANGALTCDNNNNSGLFIEKESFCQVDGATQCNTNGITGGSGNGIAIQDDSSMFANTTATCDDNNNDGISLVRGCLFYSNSDVSCDDNVLGNGIDLSDTSTFETAGELSSTGNGQYGVYALYNSSFRHQDNTEADLKSNGSGGVRLFQSSTAYFNNNLDTAQCGTYGGLVEYGSDLRVVGIYTACTVTAPNSSYGLFLNNDSSANVGTTFTGNSATVNGLRVDTGSTFIGQAVDTGSCGSSGVYVYRGSYVYMSGNMFAPSNGANSIHVDEQSSVWINGELNGISSTSYGIRVSSQSTIRVNGDIDVTASQRGVLVEEQSQAFFDADLEAADTNASIDGVIVRDSSTVYVGTRFEAHDVTGTGLEVDAGSHLIAEGTGLTCNNCGDHGIEINRNSSVTALAANAQGATNDCILVDNGSYLDLTSGTSVSFGVGSTNFHGFHISNGSYASVGRLQALGNNLNGIMVENGSKFVVPNTAGGQMSITGNGVNGIHVTGNSEFTATPDTNARFFVNANTAEGFYVGDGSRLYINTVNAGASSQCSGNGGLYNIWVTKNSEFTLIADTASRFQVNQHADTDFRLEECSRAYLESVDFDVLAYSVSRDMNITRSSLLSGKDILCSNSQSGTARTLVQLNSKAYFDDCVFGATGGNVATRAKRESDIIFENCTFNGSGTHMDGGGTVVAGTVPDTSVVAHNGGAAVNENGRWYRY